MNKKQALDFLNRDGEALYLVAQRSGSSGALSTLLARLASQEFGRDWEIHMVRDVMDLRRAHQRLTEIVYLDDIIRRDSLHVEPTKE